MNDNRIKITSKWLKEFEHEHIRLQRELKRTTELEKSDKTHRSLILLKTQIKAIESQIKDLRRDLYELENY